MSFKKAVKYDAKIRLALAGPAGSGKTYTALALATRFGGKIAVVDTEHGSASKYADIFDFDVMEMQPPYRPDRFVEAINDAETGGYSTVIIDSISHAWTGTGGLLDEVNSIAKRKGGSFNAWQEATPMQNNLMDTIIGCGIHVIVTMRAKQDYVVEEKGGKATPRKVGMAPIQRDGVEYEFDVYGMMDDDNNMVISKTRCPQLAKRVFKEPGAELADIIMAWLKGEKPAEPPKAEPAEHKHALPPEPKEAPPAKTAKREKMEGRLDVLLHDANRLSGDRRYNPFHLTNHLKKHYSVDNLDDLTDEQMGAFGKALAAEVAELEAAAKTEQQEAA
jgi:DNA polymerase III delta prime subunit